MMENSITRKIAKNYSWLLFGSLISGTVNFFLGIYLARVLGAVSFGLFQFAKAFLNYLILTVDSGLPLFGTCEVAKDKKNALFISINILMVRLFIAIVLFLLSIFILWMLPLSLPMRLLFVFTFLYVFYRALNIEWAFQGLEKMGYISAAKILYAVIVLLLIIFWVKAPSDLLPAALIQSVAGIMVSLLFIFFLFRGLPSEEKVNISMQAGWQYFLRSLPLGVSAYLVQIYNNMDTIMLGFMDKPQVVGYYGSAYQIYYIVLSFFILWQSTAMPIAALKMEEGKGKASTFLERYLRLTMLAIMPLAFFVFMAAPLIIKGFFGGEYMEAIPALRILMWTIIPCAIGNTYGLLLLVPAGRYNAFLMAVTGGALINLVLNFALIPNFSFVGAAVATIIAEATVAVIAIYYSNKIFYLPIVKSLVKPALFSLTAFVPAMLFLSFVSPWFKFADVLVGSLSFLLIYAGMVFMFERQFILGFVNEVLRRRSGSL